MSRMMGILLLGIISTGCNSGKGIDSGVAIASTAEECEQFGYDDCKDWDRGYSDYIPEDRACSEDDDFQQSYDNGWCSCVGELDYNDPICP